MAEHDREDGATGEVGEGEKKPYSAVVVTVSDRAWEGVYEDESGPALADFLREHGFEVRWTTVVPDNSRKIKKALREAVQTGIQLVVTTGGTGFSPRDITPEATQSVCERMVPGIPEAMRAASMQVTDRACLSRGVAGIADRSLIVNLPGSPKGAVENLSAVIDAIPHGLDVLTGRGDH